MTAIVHEHPLSTGRMPRNQPAEQSAWTVPALISKAIHADETKQYRLAGLYITRALEILARERSEAFTRMLQRGAVALIDVIEHMYDAAREARQAGLAAELFAEAVEAEDFQLAAGILDGRGLDRGGYLRPGPVAIVNPGPVQQLRRAGDR